MPKPSILRRLKFSQQDLLTDALMNSIFLIICIGTCSLLLVTGDDQIFIYFMFYILAIPAAALFILRRLNVPAIPMILLHFTVALTAPFLFAGMGPVVVLTAFAACMALMVYSIISLFRDQASNSSPSLLLVSLFLHLTYLFISSMRGSNHLTPLLTSGFLVSVCLYLAVRQIFSFRKGFDHFLTSPTQPGKLIQINNNRIILLLCIVTAIIFPLSIVFPYEYLVDFFKMIGSYVILFIGYLLRLLPVFRENVQEQDPEYTTGRVLSNPVTSTGTLSQILDFLVSILFIFILLYTLIRVLPAIISFIRTHFLISQKTVNFMSSRYITDETINLDKTAHRKNKKLPAFGTGEERKIRKEYYNQVREAKAKGAAITAASSAEEIRTTIFDQFGKDISELTNRYEKVRYGPGSQSQTGRSLRKR